ncbi:MAG: D-glycero-beta-D-manno-heptose 1,7-bisphosphate 7-phosphatase [Deltaproteobacteria bacterium]|nr:D-glycero-beta-D-manno-heptose 1,7-bisphosphate 7-phosphatase [Deltaproteobacteria bacterium]
MSQALVSLSPAIFLDRDGVINEDRGYVWRWADWRWLPGSFEALKALKAAGFKLVIVTNQAGVARGLYKEADVQKLHERLALELKKQNIALDGAYYCPHHPDFTGPCACRKPEPGLIFQAAQDLGLDLAASFLVGDKTTDIAAGIKAGVTSLLVRSGYGLISESAIPQGIQVFDDLAAASRFILNNHSRQ